MKKNIFVIMFVTVITMMGLMFFPGCKEEDTTENPLINIKWILESIYYSDQSQVDIQDSFWIKFNEDRTVEMQVDCNYCSGSYEIGPGDFLGFYTPLTCTEAYCGNDSPDSLFQAALRIVSRYEVVGNRLHLYFSEEGSRLNLVAE